MHALLSALTRLAQLVLAAVAVWQRWTAVLRTRQTAVEQQQDSAARTDLQRVDSWLSQSPSVGNSAAPAQQSVSGVSGSATASDGSPPNPGAGGFAR